MQPLDAARAFLLVQVDDRLGVRLRPVHVALRLELGAELAVVVDLAAEGQPDRSVLVRHRLMPGGREVDDREAAVPEGDALLGEVPRAAVVGPAVMDALAHGRHELLVDREVVAGPEEPADAAHQLVLGGA